MNDFLFWDFYENFPCIQKPLKNWRCLCRFHIYPDWTTGASVVDIEKAKGVPQEIMYLRPC